MIEEILKDRGDKYGEFKNRAIISQKMKSTIYEGMKRSGKDEGDIPDYMWEALDMIAHKISRIVNGDPFYDDSWIDIVGYAQLVIDELRRNIK